MNKKCPTCGRDMHKAYGGWVCGVCAYEPEDNLIGGVCLDCKHWEDAGNYGVCDLFSEDITGQLCTDWGPIMTKPNFGCVEWEAKEE